jgi:hypothetical protein
MSEWPKNNLIQVRLEQRLKNNTDYSICFHAHVIEAIVNFVTENLNKKINFKEI